MIWLFIAPIAFVAIHAVYTMLMYDDPRPKGPECITGNIRRQMDINLGLDPNRHPDLKRNRRG